MVKNKEDVIADFNQQINMSVDELQAWLNDPKSKTAGTGVGLESGHKIIEILKKNPTKDPEKYDEEDLEHMRKVVGYNKRHMAGEDHLKETKTKEELEKTKSAISMKNWGHDPVKTLDDTVAEDEAQGKGSVTGPAKEASEEPSAGAEGMGAKRKLEESEGEEEDITAAGKDATAEDAHEVDAGNEDDEERPRKKSKTNGDVEKHEEEEEESAVNLEEKAPEAQ